PTVSASLFMMQPPVKTSAVRASTYAPDTVPLPPAISGEAAEAISAVATITFFMTSLARRIIRGEGWREATIVPERIGFIGLGVMGKPMAKHLVTAGHHLTVHNRSRGAVDELMAAGAAAAGSPAEVARASSIVITMLPDTPDVERVIAGDNGVIAGMQKGTVVIDMSSVSPVATERLATLVGHKGGAMLDAPV